MNMNKNELLKSIGFSDEFIAKLDSYEKEQRYEVEEQSFPNDISEYVVKDTSDLYFENKENTDSNRLIFK